MITAGVSVLGNRGFPLTLSAVLDVRPRLPVSHVFAATPSAGSPPLVIDCIKNSCARSLTCYNVLPARAHCVRLPFPRLRELRNGRGALLPSPRWRARCTASPGVPPEPVVMGIGGVRRVASRASCAARDLRPGKHGARHRIEKRIGRVGARGRAWDEGERVERAALGRSSLP